jgi:hypothetical protein
MERTRTAGSVVRFGPLFHTDKGLRVLNLGALFDYISPLFGFGGVHHLSNLIKKPTLQ